MADKFLDKTGLAYFWEKIKAYFQSQLITPPEYTIVRLVNEEVGYAASYVLKKDGTQVGTTINIPKDYLVRSGEVKTVTVAEEPYEGAVVGEKYLDFVVNTVDDSGNTSHIYIPVSDLVDAYIASNGIQISDNNYISVKVSQQGVDHGLGVGGDGLTVRMVTPSINGVGGMHGAMYAADKEKLDELEIVGVFTTGSDTAPVIEGKDGLVPAPSFTERGKFLRGDATWANPSENTKPLQNAVADPTGSGDSIEFISNITQDENGVITPLKKTVRTMLASGQNHAPGIVPDPGAVAGTTRYLCENGTWSEPNGDGGGAPSTPTDVQINGTSITSNNVANIQTEGSYDASTNKIATMEDLPSVPEDGNTAVKMNGYSGSHGITPLSLCAFAVWSNGTTTTMESLSIGGGIGVKQPITNVSFPIGCKIYYHPDTNAFQQTTNFTSKLFYSSYNEVDARYTATTGQSVSLGSSSSSGVFLRVLVSGTYWLPFYKSGDSTEIIVTTNQLAPNNFYIYLGKTVGESDRDFQLEDNNPLYYYDGTNLIDWATYQASEAAPSYTAGDGININNGVISCTPRPYKKEVFNTASFNASSAYSKGWQNFVSTSNLEVGTYKVTLQVHLYIVSNDDNMMPADCVVNVCMRNKVTSNDSFHYILGATETLGGGTLPETAIATGRGIISRTLNVVGFMEVTGDEDSSCSLEAIFTTNSSLNVLIGNPVPRDGTYDSLCSGNDFVLLEKIA